MPMPHARPWMLRVLTGALAAAGVALLTLQGLGWRIDTWLYDRMLAGIRQPVDDRIALVVIDDKSLAALGRWPWPRGVHAELVQKLTAAGARGIAFDVLFSDPDPGDVAGDEALANAIRLSGRVVSPVAAEPSQPDGTLIEVLPMSSVIGASAALGHVEIDADPDGVARQAPLYAGLGSAHWPMLALALRNLDPGARRQAPLPGLRSPAGHPSVSPHLWNRDYRILIPYAPAGSFRRVSYVDVLHDDVPGTLFRDRWLLVGTTATGMLRETRVPGDGRNNRVPGVEYHAHVLNALLQGNAIVPITLPQQLGLGMLLALVPLLVYRPRHRMRRPWLAAMAGAVAALAASALLLHFGRYWFAPASTLLVVAIGYAAWSMPSLRRSQRLAGQDALTRLASRHMFDLTLERELASARRSSRTLSLLLVDVDHFKPYNDHYGRQAGDAVLRSVADVLMLRARRPRDLVARYGDDVFALVLPETSAHAAAAIAQAILDDVRAKALPHERSPVAPVVTLSIGIATCHPTLETGGIDLSIRAGAALHRAKR